MQAKDITRMCLAAGGLAGQQGELTMCDRVLGQIIDDDKRMLASVTKILGDREAGERRNPLQAGRGRSGSVDENTAIRSAVAMNGLDNSFHRS